MLQILELCFSCILYSHSKTVSNRTIRKTDTNYSVYSYVCGCGLSLSCCLLGLNACKVRDLFTLEVWTILRPPIPTHSLTLILTAALALILSLTLTLALTLTLTLSLALTLTPTLALSLTLTLTHSLLGNRRK